MPSAPEQQFSVPKASHDGHGRSSNDLFALGARIGNNVLLFAVAILIAALAWLTYTSKPASEAKLVDATKLQAVFLNTGQVYFGNISALNKDFTVLHNVYYLQSQTSTTTKSTSPNLSLIKLGCELHMPYDQMIINSSQVTFWENLSDNGQVGKAVAQFKSQNPNGQQCSSAPSSSSTSNLQNSATSKP